MVEPWHLNVTPLQGEIIGMQTKAENVAFSMLDNIYGEPRNRPFIKTDTIDQHSGNIHAKLHQH